MQIKYCVFLKCNYYALMKHFATALKIWMDIEQPDLTVRKLSEMTGLPGSDISHWRIAFKGITFKALSKLLPVVYDRYGTVPATKLLIAYLKDEVPEGFESFVAIEEKAEAVAIDADLHPEDAALAYFRQRMATDSDFAEWIIKTHAMISEVDYEASIQKRLQVLHEHRESANKSASIVDEPQLMAAEEPAQYTTSKTGKPKKRTNFYEPIIPGSKKSPGEEASDKAHA